MLEIKIRTLKELDEQFKMYRNDIKIAVIDAILNGLENKEKTAAFCKLMPIGVILEVEDSEYLIGLEKNMDILIENEDYEKAAIVRDWIIKLKNEPEFLNNLK